jgi:hypothetical protein
VASTRERSKVDAAMVLAEPWQHDDVHSLGANRRHDPQAHALYRNRGAPSRQRDATLRRRGRRVMIYGQHTGTRDLLPRLQSILARHGVKAAILRSSTVSPEKR